MSRIDIDLTKRKGHFKRGLFYNSVGSVGIDGEANEGKRLAFLTALTLGEIVGHGAGGNADCDGIDGLNEYVDCLCDGFVLQDISYTPVKVESDGRIIIRVEGEITDY